MKNSSYHGYYGHLCVEHSLYISEIAKAFLKAGEKFGYKIVDYNGEEQIGFSFIQTNLDSGARCSAAKAYLQVNRLKHCDSSKGDETFRREISSRCDVRKEQTLEKSIRHERGNSLGRYYRLP